jgi:molybdenum cofactor cytidylyltransferase
VFWVVIPAAGESRRMRTQKLLLPFGETTAVGAVVGTALASRVDRVPAVLGADKDDVREEIEPLGIDLAVNEYFAEGLLSSVRSNGDGAGIPSSSYEGVKPTFCCKR